MSAHTLRRHGVVCCKPVPEMPAHNTLCRGPLAVLVTRPVPLAGETVAVLAGASGMGWTRCALAATAGALPEAVLYSWAGASVR